MVFHHRLQGVALQGRDFALAASFRIFEFDSGVAVVKVRQLSGHHIHRQFVRPRTKPHLALDSRRLDQRSHFLLFGEMKPLAGGVVLADDQAVDDPLLRELHQLEQDPQIAPAHSQVFFDPARRNRFGRSTGPVRLGGPGGQSRLEGSLAFRGAQVKPWDRAEHLQVIATFVQFRQHAQPAQS